MPALYNGVNNSVKKPRNFQQQMRIWGMNKSTTG